MRRFVLLFATMILMGSTLSAQIAPGKKYTELKTMYNPKEYVKTSADPYSTFWAGAGSFLVPGLGQVICREAGRGIAIFAGDVALSVAASMCANKFMSYAQKDASGNYMRDSSGSLIMTDEKAARKWGVGVLGISLAGFGYWIWNICDAVKVAKVKNMYFNDLQGHSMVLDMYPSFNYTITPEGSSPVTGMTLSLKF